MVEIRFDKTHAFGRQHIFKFFLKWAFVSQFTDSSIPIAKDTKGQFNENETNNENDDNGKVSEEVGSVEEDN